MLSLLTFFMTGAFEPLSFLDVFPFPYLLFTVSSYVESDTSVISRSSPPVPLMPFPVLALLLSTLASYLLLWLLLPHLRRRLLDHPNSRSSHQLPTPSGGGLSFVLMATSASAFEFLTTFPVSFTLSTLPLVALPLAVIGFLDDRHNLSSSFRYVCQLATSVLLVMASPLPIPLLALLLLLISCTAVINFTNFMDGLDGLVAGCMAVAISSLAIALSASWPIWVLVGSLIGFLILNWSPARVFMGDVGSTFLGAVFIGLVLQASSWSQSLAYLLVATPLLADAFICVTRRWLAGQPIFQAHRLHLFQRLHQAGWSHSSVSFVYISATALLAGAMLLGGLAWVIGISFMLLLVGVCLDKRVAVSFAVALKS